MCVLAHVHTRKTIQKENVCPPRLISLELQTQCPLHFSEIDQGTESVLPYYSLFRRGNLAFHMPLVAKRAEKAAPAEVLSFAWL